MIFSGSELFSIQTLTKIGMLIFAIFGWLGVAGSSFGAGLLLVIALFQFPDFWNKMVTQPIFWLSLGAILFLILLSLFTDSIDQLTSEYAVKYTKSMIYLWLFIIIGWHLYSHNEMARWMIGVAILGLIAKILMETDWHNFNLFINRRQDFGFSIAGAGLHIALSIWGLIILSIFIYKKYIGIFRLLIILLALVCVVVLGEASVVTQARSSWVSMWAGFVFVFILLVLKEKKILHLFNIQQLAFSVALIFIILGILIAANYKILSNRITDDNGVYGTLLSFNREQIPYNSAVGARAHMLLYGMNLWLEKPFFGWGVGSSRSLLAQDEIIKAGDHPHFHNNYLEILVEQGVVGFSFYFVAFVLLMHGLFKAYSEGVVPKDIFYYLIGSWVMVLVWSLADSRMVHADLRFVLLLLSGMTFAFILIRDDEKNIISDKLERHKRCLIVVTIFCFFLFNKSSKIKTISFI